MTDEQVPLRERELERLIEVAAQVRERAYVPYSHFPVGAALAGKSGRVYTGCNVENAAFGLTLCAERNAVFHAVAEGEREFDLIVVVTANGVTPCGSCRQVLAEFNPDLTVVVADTAGHHRTYSVRDLLPDGFGPAQLPKP